MGNKKSKQGGHVGPTPIVKSGQPPPQKVVANERKESPPQPKQVEPPPQPTRVEPPPQPKKVEVKAQSVARSADEELKVNRRASASVIKEWSDNESILPEYLKAYQMCFVKREFMKKSKIDHVIEYLDGLMDEKFKSDWKGKDGIKIGTEKYKRQFEGIVIGCIKKAYSLKSDDLATEQECMVWEIPVFHRVCRVYSELEDWRVKYLFLALRELENKLDSGTLVSLLADLAKAGNECLGRKRIAFHMILDVVDPTRDWGNKTDESKDDLGNSLRVIQDFMRNYIDQFKLKAFRTAFLEPATACLAAMDEAQSILDSVNVHGFSVYSTILIATVGVRVPMIGWIDDPDCELGCVDFLHYAKNSSKMQLFLEDLKKPENFGKGYQAIHGHSFKLPRKVQGPENLFLFPGKTPREIAHYAARDNSSDSNRRILLAAYLENFMSYFTVEFFVEKALSSLVQERETHVDEIFRNMKQSGLLSKEGDDEEVKFWLWDVMSGKFNLQRGIQLLQFCQIINS
jgi:hypothetical protein